MRVYLAGGIFFEGDLYRNTAWAKKIRDAFPGIDLYSPVENTDINGVEGKKKFAGSKEIAEADNARLDNTDILLACIDGDVLPAGTSAEIGVMREKIRRGDHKYVIGICTDNRECSRTHSEAKDSGGAAGICEQQYSYQNLYVVGCIKEAGILVSNIDDAIKFMKKVAPEFEQEYIDDNYNDDIPGVSYSWQDIFSKQKCNSDEPGCIQIAESSRKVAESIADYWSTMHNDPEKDPFKDLLEEEGAEYSCEH